MKKLYIHIGTHKTATTWLQHFLGKNSRRLEDHGFYYPKAGRVNQAQHRLGQAIFRRPKPVTSLNDVPVWQKFKHEISLTNCENIVLSSEEFEWVGRPNIIREYLSGVEIHVVVYLRRQDDYLESLYGQQIRDFGPRLTKTIDRYIADSELRFLDYKRLVDRWKSASDQLTVRIFDRGALKDGDIGTDFLSVLGIYSRDGFEIPTAAMIDHKASMGLEALEFIRQCNFLKLDPASHRELVGQVIKLDKIASASLGKDSRRLLSFDQRKSIVGKYIQGNRHIAQHYFQGGSLPDLFPAVKEQGPVYPQSDDFNRFEVALKVSQLVKTA